MVTKNWADFKKAVVAIEKKLTEQNGGKPIDDLPMVGAPTCEGNVNCWLPYDDAEIITHRGVKTVFLPL